MTTCGYDFRNRLETADGEIDFFEKYFYDNQDRLTKTERRDTTSAGTLLAQSETKYDDLGRVFQSLQYSVTSGSAGNSLKEKIWYSPTGQVIKRVPMGTQAFQKMQYDGVGRVTKSFVCFDPNELDTNYSAADDVEYDTVLRQIENTYDAASNLIQVTTRNRFHDATLTGELTSPGGAQPKARVSYLAFYPDALGRMVEVADYGTNGASSFSRSDTKPAGSDLILVSQTAYNTRGEAFQFTDPKGIVTLRGFDDAGRVFQKVEDRYGVVRTTDFTHTADSQLATLTAVNGVTGNQTTTWTYGTTLSDSDVASNDLLRFEQYPDGSSSDRVEYKYNRLGEVKEIKAQNGTVRSLKYDKLGRLEHDCADTLGSNVDGAVRRLTRSYEARGLLEKLTSYDNATPGSGSVVNEVKYEYNGFMLLTKESQSHQGAVTSSTPAVQYGYTDGSNNHARRITCTSPDGTVLEYDYGYPN
ncbi:MAG: RHS repeat-associated core domain-containing protein, partial [Verrucomicrobia bacterium]|nr:RHS repeat-associated core domain-containing protein [Verrucomicrobiota bacterium]